MQAALSTLLTRHATATENANRPQRPQVERLEPVAAEVRDAAGRAWVCYTPDGGRELGHLLIDYHTLWAYAVSLEAEATAYKLEIGKWEARLELWRGVAEEQRRTVGLFRTAYTEEHRLRLETEGRESFYRWIPWGLMVVQSVVFVAISAVGSAH